MSMISERVRRLFTDPAAQTGAFEAVWNGAVIARSDRTVVVDHVALWGGVRVRSVSSE